MNIAIVKMTDEHLDAAAKLERECFSMPWSRQSFQDAIASDNYEYIAAVSDGQLVGYAGMQVSMDEAEITNIAVAKEYRRLGVAQKLLEGLTLLCARKSVRYLHLEVRVSNAPARRLYEKTGFQTDGCRRNFYRKPQEDAILMTKIL